MGNLFDTFTLLGLGVPLAISVGLDWLARKDLKLAVAEKLSLHRGLSPQQVTSLSYDFARSIFYNKSYIIRVVSVVIFSIFSLVIITIIQYHFNRSAFEADTKKFIFYIFDGHWNSSITIISFVVVDAISIYQTIFFLKISRTCTSIVELIFLGFADFVMSLMLVLVVVPAALSLLFYVSNRPEANRALVGFSSMSLSQDLDFDGFVNFLIFSPMQEATGNEQYSSRRILENGWVYDGYRMMVEAHDLSKRRVEDVQSYPVEAGNALIFTKGAIDSKSISGEISNIFNRFYPTIILSSVDSYDSVMGGTVFVMELQGKYDIAGVDLIAFYLRIMREVNFFGDDLEKVFKIDSMPVTENSIYYAEALS